MSSTRTETEIATMQEIKESFERAANLFTVLFKTYGYTDARRLIGELKDSEYDGILQEVLRLTMSDLDACIQPSERLREIFGSHMPGQSGRIIRCTDCRPPTRAEPVLARALICAHWTAGATTLFCHFCAAQAGVCVSCGVPTT